jgi:hypothetical protein
MLRLFLAQRLLGLLMTLVIGVAAWFLVGKNILDDLKDETAREEGGGPRSERIYRRSQFEPAVARLRDEVGPGARLLEVSMRADRLEFHIRRGRDADVYVSENGDYDNLKKDDSVIATVPASSAYSLRRLDSAAPQRIVARIEKREGGGDFLTTQFRLLRDGGKLSWSVNGRVGQRGVGYYASPDGRRVETAAAHFSP